MDTIKPTMPDAERTAGSLHRDCSAATFICEVGVVNTETRTTGWREVARYATEESAMDFVACNSHCVCRYRKETPPNDPSSATRLGDNQKAK